MSQSNTHGSGYVLRRVCMICKVEHGTTPTTLPEQHGMISHGYCPACFAVAMATLIPAQNRRAA